LVEVRSIKTWLKILAPIFRSFAASSICIQLKSSIVTSSLETCSSTQTASSKFATTVWPGKLEKYQEPGTDVMITIFCDFRQFSAKKLAFFSKTNVMIKCLHNLALF
jgi:hypothetical protein